MLLRVYKVKVVLNSRLKHPRVVIEDSGNFYIEVNPKDKDNFKLHKSVLKNNEEWIKDQVSEKEKNRPFPISKDYEFVDGMSIYIMGRVYKLKIVSKGKTQIEGKYLLVEGVSSRGKIRKFFIENYQEYILDKVKEYRVLLGIKSVEIDFKEFNKKFGLCKNGEIIFNWKILMLDPYLIDYVVLHEVAHLKEMNHNEAFWSQVLKIMPDYRERDNQLRIHREIVLKF